MVIVPSQGLKGTLIFGGVTKTNVWKGIVFIDPQIKNAHSEHRDDEYPVMMSNPAQKKKQKQILKAKPVFDC